MKQSRREVLYYLMLGSMFLRLFWLVVREPHGAKKAVQNVLEINSLPGIAAQTIPYVVYPSIIIMVVIIMGSLFKKRWAYISGVVFGAAHLVLTMSLVFMKVSPGFGPAVVLPASVMMIVFSFLVYKGAIVRS